ncbi:MAG: PKD domain-containing protein [Gallionella sp.]|nr:PKD domain-containing protein [Gallionella sp.]
MAAFVANDATGVWQLAGGMIPGCSTIGDTGTITLYNYPSRFNGVAPLSVFFDTAETKDNAGTVVKAGTTANATTRTFHDLEYRWDFGDPAGGATWSAGSRADVSRRNEATGPVAAHVYETPGVYIVSLSATDGTNTVSNSCAQIVVQDPNTVFSGSNTICIGASVVPTAGANGCPTDASTAQQSSFPSAISSYAKTGKRVLFKRGDTFTATTSASLTMTGPGIIGAFGTGAAPIVQMTGDTTILNLSSASTPTMNDWRIMDLEFDGFSKTNSLGIGTMGTIKQVLVLNMNIHDIMDGIEFNGAMLEWLVANGYPAHTMFDEMAIVDSIITPITGSTVGGRIFASALHLSIMGNKLGDMVNAAGSGWHVVRTPYIGKGVIANNTLARSNTYLALKLHGPAWCHVNSLTDDIPGDCLTWNNDTSTPAGFSTYTYTTTTHPIGIFAALSGYTEQVLISDNDIIGADSPYLVVMGPQNSHRDERVRDVIVERNHFKAGNKLTQTALVIHSYETTVRNNICDMSVGSSGTSCFYPTLYLTGPARPPHDIRIYNNTGYKSDAGSEFNLVRIDTTSTNVTVQNNLAYAPLAGSTMMVSGTGASGLITSNNSTDYQIKNTSPGWAAATPSTPADFSLNADSYARDTGASAVPVFSDIFLTSRPRNGVTDIGAVEGP